MYIALPHYQAALAKCRFEEADWTAGGSDRLIDSLTAWGSNDDILARAKEYGNVGANRIVLNVVCEDETQRQAGKPPVIIGDWNGIDALSAVLPGKPPAPGGTARLDSSLFPCPVRA
jgi:hypothetical protein